MYVTLVAITGTIYLLPYHPIHFNITTNIKDKSVYNIYISNLEIIS